MKNYKNEFVLTKEMYACYFPAELFPMSWEQWLEVSDDYKVGALYLNFYDTISLAKSKAEADYIADSDLVSILLQYLLKNVDIIIDHKERYTPSYIYRVAYNAMGMLRTVSKYKNPYEYETSDTICLSDSDKDTDASIFTVIRDTLTTEDIIMDKLSDIIMKNLSPDTQLYFAATYDGGRQEKTFTRKEKKLMNEEILKTFCKLGTEIFSIFGETDHKTTFGEIFTNDDNIQSAVVVMPDGTKTAYYGESNVKKGVTYITFFGPNKDYILSYDVAKSLEVEDVEWYD